MNFRSDPWWRGFVPHTVLLIAGIVAACLLLAGCDMQPKGTIMFQIEGKKKDLSRASLNSPPGVEPSPPIKLKWVDTNTFLTKATLAPGPYVFSGFTTEGYYYRKTFTHTPDKRKYVFPETGDVSSTTGTASQAPVLAGVVLTGGFVPRYGGPPPEVTVLFIGRDVAVRHAQVINGRFIATPPYAGTFRVEVLELGATVKSFVKESLDVRGKVDLGQIELK